MRGVRITWVICLAVGLAVSESYTQIATYGRVGSLVTTVTGPDGQQITIKPCATKPHLDKLKALPIPERSPDLGILSQTSAPKKLIPLAFHILTDEEGNGHVPIEAIYQQIEVLNRAFRDAQFVFVLRKVDVTVNTAWFRNPFDHLKAITSSLAVDPAGTVNIYTAGMLGSNAVLGFAFVPWAYPEDDPMHSILLDYTTLPGISQWANGLGGTAIHEMGHYFGLLHTFEGGCQNGPDVGDLVEDTPAQMDGLNVFECDDTLDTCPDDPGKDPVHNYMNYTSDACRFEFTPGQVQRMRWAQEQFRPSLAKPFVEAITSIVDIRTSDADGTYIYVDSVLTVQGIVTAVNQTNTRAYLQDSTAGIAVYDSSFVRDVRIGDFVKITGTLSAMNGLAQLTDVSQFEIIAQDLAVRPLSLSLETLSYPDSAEHFESQLIQIQNVELIDPNGWIGNGTSFNVQVVQGGDTLTLWIDQDTDLSTQPVPAGDVLDITGLLSQDDAAAPFDSGFRLIPRRADDIVDKFYVTGQITDQSSGSPIPSASIKLNGKNYQSDQGGNYAIPLVPGFYRMIVEAWGYQDATYYVDLRNSTFVQDIALLALTPGLPYTTRFEGSDEPGQAETGDGQGESWKRSGGFTFGGTTLTPAEGDSFLVFGGANGYNSAEYDWWFSPSNSPIDLTEYVTAQLNFKLYLDTEPTQDGLYVYLKQNRSDGSYDLYSLDTNTDGLVDGEDYFSGQSNGWMDVFIDLTSFAGTMKGKDVQIAFLFQSDGQNQPGFGVAIDSLVISGEKQSIPQPPLNLTAVSYQPGMVSLDWDSSASMPAYFQTSVFRVGKTKSSQASPNLLDPKAQKTVSWLVAPFGRFVEYRVFRKSLSLPGGEYELVGKTTSTYFSDTSPQDGQHYQYAVTAVYEEGESAFSNEEYATPGVPATFAIADTQTFEDQGLDRWSVIYYHRNGWQLGDAQSASSDSFVVAKHTRFAYVNDDIMGKPGNSSSTLLSPWYSSVGLDSLQLQFDTDSQTNGARHLIGIRTALSETWTVIDTMGDTKGWEHRYYDISPYAANKTRFQLLFVYEDPGVKGRGWALDNIRIEPLQAGELTGIVTSSYTQDRIEGARVSIPYLKLETSTDSTGSFSLQTVPRGTYSVRIQAFDHLDTLLSSVSITRGQVASVNVELQKFYPPPQVVSARVDDQMNIGLSWNAPLPHGQIAYDDGTPDTGVHFFLPPPADELIAVKFVSPWESFIVTDIAALFFGGDPRGNFGWETKIASVSVVADVNGWPGLDQVYYSLTNVPVDSGMHWQVWSPGVTVTAGSKTFWVVFKWDPSESVGAHLLADGDKPIAGYSYRSEDGGTTWKPLMDPVLTWVPLDAIVRAFVKKAGQDPSPQVVAVRPTKDSAYLPLPIMGGQKGSQSLVGKRTRLRALLQMQSSGLAGMSVPNDLIGFEIYRRLADRPSEPFSMIAQVGKNIMSYTDSNIEIDQPYEYFVKAVYEGNAKSGRSSIRKIVVQKIHPLPFATDFEADGGKFVSFSGWEWGKPGYTKMPDRGASGVNVWGTLLDSTYQNYSSYDLISPAFELPPDQPARLSFKAWFDIEPDIDFGYVLVGLPNINSWSYLNFSNGITGKSNGWKEFSFDLSSMQGYPVTVMFRLWTDGDGNNFEGWLIDDFRLVAGQTGGLRGVVMAAEDSSAIAGAVVQVQNKSGARTTTTDSSGTYKFPLLQTGDYQISISADNFRRLVDSVRVWPDSTVEANFVLQKGLPVPSLAVYPFGPDARLEWNSPPVSAPQGRGAQEPQAARERIPSMSLKSTAYKKAAFSANRTLLGFKIFRGTGWGAMALLDSVAQDVYQYVDTSAPADSSYSYGLVAIYDNGASDMILRSYYHPPYLLVSEVRVDSDPDLIPDRAGKVVSTKGVVTSPNFSMFADYYIQDGSGGINIYAGQQRFELSYGDEVYVYGTVEQYAGKTRIVVSSDKGVQIVNRGMPLPEPEVIQPSELGEAVEGRLVRLNELQILDLAQWPAEGEDGHVLAASGADTLVLRIDKDTDLDGWNPPLPTVQVTGIADQFTFEVPPVGGYQILLRSRDDIQIMTSVKEGRAIPTRFLLRQNYPNPFNPSTAIQYELPKAAEVLLVVYDILGRQVRELVDTRQNAGYYTVTWDGRNDRGMPVAGGIYLYRITAGSYVKTLKMVLVK
jgi:hypothetical protein